MTALAKLAQGDQQAAIESAEAAVTDAKSFGTPDAIGSALRTLGLAKGAEGIEDLQEAVRLLETASPRLMRPRALVELGAALRRNRRRREARDFLLQGLELARRSGATALADQAREELAAMGARPRSEVLSGVESLTASELRVAKLATRGLTNREIAQQLFVTMKTVETHLRHCYQKLEISGRAELGSALGAPSG